MSVVRDVGDDRRGHDRPVYTPPLDDAVPLDPVQLILINMFADLFEPMLRDKYRREHDEAHDADGGAAVARSDRRCR